MAEATMPPERDTKDFKFQQLCKVRVKSSPTSLPPNRSSLIVASSKYNLTFVGIDGGFKVLRTSDFIAKDQEYATDRLKHIITDFGEISSVNVGQEVTHLGLSADDLTLAVAVFSGQCPTVYMYDVRNFAGQVSEPVNPFHTISGEGDRPLNDLCWNPVDPNLLIVCFSTGRLDIYNGQTRRSSLTHATAKCACWSPKGKQLVAGKSDGTLVQYDFDLNEKKKWARPTILNADLAFEVLDLTWISTYSFMVAYTECDSDQSEQPQLVLINGSKEGPITYTNFEDPCFGTGEDRNRKYHFHMIQRWDLILSASSNASEIGVVGRHPDEQDKWMRWNLDDASRAECPLTEDYNDTYPMGVTIDYSSQAQIPLGDEKMHPPSPLMLILSTEGLIIPYHVMYMRPQIPQVTVPPQVLSSSGVQKGSAPAPAPPQATSTPAAPQPQPGAVKNLFGMGASAPSTSKPAATSSIFGSGGTAGSTSASGPGSSFSFNTSSQAPAPTNLFENSGAKPKFTGFGVSGTTPSSNTEQTGSKPLFGAGLTTGSKTDQSGGTPLFGSGLTSAASSAKTEQSGTKPLFGSGMTAPTSSVKTDQSENKSVFGSGFGSFASLVNKPQTTETKSSEAPSFGGSSQTGSTKTEQTDIKLPPSAGFATTTFGATNKSGATAGFSFTPSFGAPSSGGVGSPAVQPKTTPSIETDAVPVKPGSSSAAVANTPGSTFAAGSLTSSQNSQAGIFGFKPAAGSTVATGAAQVPVVSKPVPTYAGQSSAFTGIPTSSNKPVQRFEVPPSDQTQHEKFVPKSPTQAPPPSYQTARARSPQLAPPSQVAPPPQYEGEAQDGTTSVTLTETNDSVDQQFSRSILDEMQHFNKELADFRSKTLDTDFTVGEKEEMSKMKIQTQIIEEFYNEVKSSVQDQNKEVQDQRALCLDLFSMAEECKMREQMKSDPKYRQLLNALALDPESAERIEHLRLQYQVLEQGLQNVDIILDSQWEDYQNRKKNRSNKISTPTNDAVYRVVKNNNSLIATQKAKLRDLEEKLKQMKLFNRTSNWTNSFSSNYTNDTNNDLSALADSLLSTSPVKASSLQSFTSMKSERPVCRNRLNRLRNHLCRRDITVVHPTKPGNLSVLQIPDTQLDTSEIPRTEDRPSLDGNDRPSTTGFAQRNNKNQSTKRSSAMSNQSTAQTNQSGLKLNQSLGSQGGRGMTGSQFGGNTGNKDGARQGFFEQILEKGKDQSKPAFSKETTKTGLNQAPPNVTVPFNMKSSFNQQQLQAKQANSVKPGSPLTVKEVNGIKLDDITPCGSENDVGTEEEDDEYDEDEETSESGDGNGEGFGLQYMTSTANVLPGGMFTTTPVNVQASAAQESPKLPAGSSTPVSRKLFGSEDTKPGSSLSFGMDAIKFGTTPTSKSTADSSSTQASKPFTFTQPSSSAPIFGNQSATASSQPGFNFSLSAGTPSFGNSQTQSVVKTEAQSTDTKTVTQSKTKENQDKKGTEPAPTGQITGLFGKSAVSTTSASAKPAVTLGQASGIFGLSSTSTPATSSTIFGQSSASTPAASSTIFGQSSASTPATSSTIFGQSVSTSAPSGLFGQNKTPVTHVIGQPSDAVSEEAQTSVKLDPAPDKSLSGGGMFGASTTSTAVSSTSLFGQNSSSGSGFSLPALTSATVSGNPLGQPTTSTTAPTALFGQATSTTASSSPFGQSGSSSVGGAGLFGTSSTATTSSAAGLFGQTSSTGTGLFGQSSGAVATTTASTGLFGQNTSSSTSTSGGTSLFGQPATSSTGLFGQSSSTSGGAGLFGQTAASTTSTGTIFGQSTSTTSTNGLFGQLATTSSGPSPGILNANTVGGGGFFGTQVSGSSGGGFNTATSGSGFGFGQPSSQSFGQPAFGQSPGFGQSSGFGGFAQTNTESGGNDAGGMLSGLGGKPSAEKANTNVFGTPQPFGSSQSGSTGLFGSGSTQTFGSVSSSSGAGGFSTGGTFSGGSGVAATGFGSPQPSSGFGGSPAFGGNPAFGGAPAFGATPAFGSAPAFGSTSAPGGFGSAPAFGSPPTGTFGSTAAAGANSSGFAGFANTGSPTFGALAQSGDAPSFGGMGQPQNTGGFANTGGGGGSSFGSSPSFTGYRG